MRARLTCVLAAALASFLLAPGALAATRSAPVAALQIALHVRGLYDGPLDGLAGAGTASGVRAFQSRAGLPATGVLDRRTRLALGPLGRPLAGKRVVGRRMAGWDVSVLEFELVRYGFDPGRLDGHFDADTRAAVRRFQHFAHLAADGVAGPTTFRALRRAKRPRSPIGLAWPIRRRVTAGFGVQGQRFHPGIELAAPYAAAVAAAGDARVVWAGWRPGGLGLTVELAHTAGVHSVYGHLARVDVKAGQRVVRGALVGLVGWTGESTKPRLYLEVRVRGAAVDPLAVLR